MGYVGLMKYNERLAVFVDEKLKESYDLERLGKNRGLVRKYVEHAYFQAFIYACIVANILVIFLEPTAEGGGDGYDYANYFFSVVFVLEFIFKTIGYSVVGYWRDPMNAFDGILAIMIGVE